MDDLSWGQRVALQDFVETGPADHALAISPRQPLLPDPHHLSGEPPQSSIIAADAIVRVVAPHHSGQVVVLVADGPVPVSPAPVAHRGHRTGKSAFGRDLPNHVPALP